MNIPTAPKTMPEYEELVSHLPVPKPPMPKNLPYLKSFKNLEPKRVIRGSKLLYTACSTKSWPAPEGDS